MKRDLLNLNDLADDELSSILEMALELKKNKHQAGTQIKDQCVGLVFQKPSNRTRVSFEVGIRQLGGHCIYLSPEEINLGKRESVADVARTLSRYLNAIVARTNNHKDLTELAAKASIPVINGLSDLYHPCQAVADLLSIKEKFGDKKVTIAYIGDGNNVCHSLLLGCAKTGLNMIVATPEGYEPDINILKASQEAGKPKGTTIFATHSPEEAVKDAEVIYADVWVSMGQEKETKKRLSDFQGFQINADLVAKAADDFIFMHCLPAHRGEEVASEVIDGDHSIVFDQAENRLHAQKAVLTFLLGH